MDYLFLKWIHILSSTLLFGTGIGSAFYMFCAHRTQRIVAIVFATRFVVLADWIFTTPAVIIQPVTGFLMIRHQGFAWSEGWLIWSLGLYLFAGACWLPVVWIQIRMRNMAAYALRTGTLLSPLYWRMERWWVGLGLLAFPAVMLVFWLMVAKPL